MKIKVRKYGPINWRLKRDEETLSINQHLKVGQFLSEELGIPEPQLRFLRIILNGKDLNRLDAEIKNDDEIVLILPMGGGVSFNMLKARRR